ncbi:MAG TPA: hypothetical protein VFU73_05950 [Actinocrinis sp.]|nr:hypothetical protein [Actinocrinis sp.]
MAIPPRLAAAAAALALVISAAVAAPQAHATASAPAAVPIAGTGHATARSVTVSAAAADARLPVRSGAATPLGRDGRPAGESLASSPSTGSRPAPTPPNGGVNTATGAHAHAAVISPNGVSSNAATPKAASPDTGLATVTSGVTQGGTGCSSCPTPDVTAAAGATELAETVNLQLQVTDKTGKTLCSVSLTNLVGALTALSGPRIQYDNAAKRFSIVVDSVPSSSTDVAVQYLATSQTADACGAWWVYSIVFSVSASYPLGALLDYPYLGQDSTSILSSTNNYAFGGSYLASAAYSMPKSAAYAGTSFNVTTYSVAFSTAPVTVAGIPTAATTNTYWIAAVPGTGYNLYTMPTNPAGAISLKSTVRAPFSAPTRKIIQPGTSQRLDPGDGRIDSAAVQDGTTLWFAQVVDDGGFPTVLYGAIGATSGTAETALAFHDTVSDDFNPSIAVMPAGGGLDYVWVNWAYTDSSFGEATSDAVAGVAPGDGVPDLAEVDLTLVSGSPTASNSSFGRYSSAAIDPAGTSSCPAGLTALTAQEYFTSGGLWTTELARTTFC